MIIVKLYKQRSIRHQLTNQERNMGHFYTSVKLIAVVVVHITLVGLPVVVARALGITGINLTNTSQAGKIVLSSITLAVLVNHSTNFLLYNIFDAEFRRKALSLFGVTNDKTSEMLKRNPDFPSKRKNNSSGNIGEGVV